MNEIALFADLIKLVLAGLIIFFIGWTVVRNYLDQRVSESQVAVRKAMITHTLPLQLQAYERVTLFLERINPSNMLLRLHVTGISAREFQQLLLADIRAEFQHNLTQQLYVSPRVWAITRRVKEDTITVISNAAQGLSEDAPSVELSKVILTHLANLQSGNPYDAALELVKSEVQQLF